VEIVRKHGRPAEHRHSLQIEVNRRLYMDETTLEANDGYTKLERDLELLVAHVAAFVRRGLGIG
jgi:N-formylglutamate deformylase